MVWTSANGPKCPVSPEDRGDVVETHDIRAATIEECAKVAEAQAREFLSPEYASNQPFSSFCERFACDEVAKAIRALLVSRPHHSPTEKTGE